MLEGEQSRTFIINAFLCFDFSILIPLLRNNDEMLKKDGGYM